MQDLSTIAEEMQRSLIDVGMSNDSIMKILEDMAAEKKLKADYESLKNKEI